MATPLARTQLMIHAIEHGGDYKVRTRRGSPLKLVECIANLTRKKDLPVVSDALKSHLMAVSRLPRERVEKLLARLAEKTVLTDGNSFERRFLVWQSTRFMTRSQRVDSIALRLLDQLFRERGPQEGPFDPYNELAHNCLSQMLSYSFRKEPGAFENFLSMYPHLAQAMTSLYIGLDYVDGEWLKPLETRTPHVTKLSLHGSQIKDTDVPHLAALPLTNLDLTACQHFTGAAFKNQIFGKALTRLIMTRSGLDDEGLGFIADLRALRILSVSETQVSARALMRLTKLSQLTVLDLSETNATDRVVIAIATALPETLRELYAYDCKALTETVGSTLAKRASSLQILRGSRSWV